MKKADANRIENEIIKVEGNYEPPATQIVKMFTKDGKGVWSEQIGHNFLFATFVQRCVKKGYSVFDLDIARCVADLNAYGVFNIQKILVCGRDKELNKKLGFEVLKLGHYVECRERIETDVFLDEWDAVLIDGIIAMHGFLMDLKEEHTQISDLFTDARTDDFKTKVTLAAA